MIISTIYSIIYSVGAIMANEITLAFAGSYGVPARTGTPCRGSKNGDSFRSQIFLYHPELDNPPGIGTVRKTHADIEFEKQESQGHTGIEL